MQQTDSVTGFSELKDLLIRTYQIKRSREFVRPVDYSVFKWPAT
jgi:hypothetical protein